MMNAAIASAQNEYARVRAHLDSRGRTDLPIVIGETGWKAAASAGEFFRAHPVNQKMYFDRLNAWRDTARATGAGPRAIVYFEAFDEPWKGRDDKWGLFNVARQARCQVQDLYANVPGVVAESGSCVATDAVSAPTVVRSTITQSRYVVYANASTADEARAGTLQWIGFGGDNGNGFTDTSFSGEVPVGTDADAPYREIAPAPASYGWGHFALSNSLAGSSEVVDLSLYEATGHLNFKLRSTYPGKLEVGFMTGSGSSAYDVYLTISNTNADGYGYLNDGQWHHVVGSLGDATIAALDASVALVVMCSQRAAGSKYVNEEIRLFKAQTYRNLELLILDNGDSIRDLVPNDASIRYARVEGKQTIGQLRNYANQLSTAEYKIGRASCRERVSSPV